MDPITALNQEFARLVEEDWSREAAVQRSEHTALTPRTSIVDRLRTMIGSAVVTLGLRLQGQEGHPEAGIGHAQIGR